MRIFFYNSYIIIYFYLLLKVCFGILEKCPFLCNMLLFLLDKNKGLIEKCFLCEVTQKSKVMMTCPLVKKGGNRWISRDGK